MDNIRQSSLPSVQELSSLLGLRWGSEIEDIVNEVLINPLDEFLNRPAKKIRGRLVELGFRLASNDMEEWSTEIERQCRQGAEVLEAIHAASLVIDDIQDGSLERRGLPTLHRSHGLSVALNAGNWLYFWPLEKMRDWDLPQNRTLLAYNVCHRALLRAHFGQAIDVGVPIDTLPQDRVKQVVLASLELKSGALMSLAMALGGILGGANEDRLEVLEEFGKAFGVALQMFDDVGNMTIEGTKQFEDLKLKRPTWIWAYVSESASKEEYPEFITAVNALPESQPLKRWMEKHATIQKAREGAKEHLEHAVAQLEKRIGRSPGVLKALQEVRKLSEVLTKSYG